MRNVALIAAAAAVLLAPQGARAGAFTFSTIDNPTDPTFNQLLGVNNNGLIAGYFGSGAAGHPNQGYTIAAPYTSFVPQNFPGSAQTQVTGLNNIGTTVGFWSDTNNGAPNDANFGFSRMGGTFTNVNNPLVGSTPAINQLLGVNDTKLAVGFYNDAGGFSHGFTVNLGTLSFAPVTVAGATSVTASAINNANLIAGFFTNAAANTLGFVENKDGTGLATFEVPGSTNTMFLGVNNKGKAVGTYTDAGGQTHGLLYDIATASFQTVDDPNGGMGTTINGLNDNNQLVGFFVDADGNTNGMLVSAVPEPSPITLMAIPSLLVLGMGWITRRRRGPNDSVMRIAGAG
jgi:hypothetical protein